MNHLVQAAQHTLLQLKNFLNQIDDAQYTASLAVFSGSSVGMHVRHVIEFYQCMVTGNAEGKIDYDARERNLQLESSTTFAKACIDRLLADLHMISVIRPITLMTEQNFEEHQLLIESNTWRELSYVIEHSIHHFAIIKIGCVLAFPTIVFDRDFGIAYSTIKFRERVHSNLSA